MWKCVIAVFASIINFMYNNNYRVIHALRLWIYYHPRDFVDDQNGLGQTLETFLQLIEE